MVTKRRAATPSLDDFRPQRRNANKHTARGVGMLESAMGRDGYVAPITVAADGEAIDGSARLEVAAAVFAGAEPIVIEHDGTRPIVCKRTDIANADTPEAQRIALAANRIAQVDLEWDADVLRQVVAAAPAAAAGLWSADELAGLCGAPPGASGQGRETSEPAAGVPFRFGEYVGRVDCHTYERFAGVAGKPDAVDVAAVLSGLLADT